MVLPITFFFYIGLSNCQPVLPQRTITVTPTQAIHFGTFALNGGTGGSVTVTYDGMRTATGGIILLPNNPTAQPAIFEIKLCQGRNVIITFDATTVLTGDNGGELILNIGPTEKGINNASFATNSDCNFTTPLRVGGTLLVTGSAVPGNYSGNLYITFNQE